jgi:glycosyltransferase involved in cell wall biosynthesis
LCGESTEILAEAGPPTRNRYWQHERLSGLMRRLGLHGSPYVRALGYVSNAHVSALIQKATALIMPSLSEGGGSYPVEEALSYGTPVLCSDIAVMREHLAARSAEIAWFDPLSPDSIADAYRRLMRDYARFKSSALHSRLDARPTWDDVGGQYLDVFERAQAGGTP